MTVKRIERILNYHGIESMIKAGRVYALETGTLYSRPYERYIDVTTWTEKKLFSWLGY